MDVDSCEHLTDADAVPLTQSMSFNTPLKNIKERSANADLLMKAVTNTLEMVQDENLSSFADGFLKPVLALTWHEISRIVVDY